MQKHSLLTDESIEAWIAENEPGGKDKLAAQVGKVLKGECAKFVLAYLARDAGFTFSEAHAQTRLSEARPVRTARVARWVGWVGITAFALGIWQLMV